MHAVAGWSSKHSSATTNTRSNANINVGSTNGRALASLTLSPGAHTLLRVAGFRSIRDVMGVKALDLASELQADPRLILAQLEEIKACLNGTNDVPPEYFQVGSKKRRTSANSKQQPQVESALSMLSRAREGHSHIVTYCQPLDEILGGGVPLAELTELCGAPGAGKTQLCTQLAVDVTIPEIFGGVGGEALYVDTEGSFSIERAHDMAAALLAHLYSIPERTRARNTELANQQAALLDAEYNDTDAVLKHIHYCRVHDYAEQLALVRTIPSLLANNIDGSHSRIRLVIIDSVAFHFRHGFANMSERTRTLNGHAQQLNALASQHGLAVVVSNQMTTRISNNNGGGGNNGSTLVPALGESWSHAITNRVVLRSTSQVADCTRILPTSAHQQYNAVHMRKSSNDTSKHDVDRPDGRVGVVEGEANAVLTAAYARLGVREASLVKSPSRMANTSTFVIVQQGIRKVPKQRSSKSTERLIYRDVNV